MHKFHFDQIDKKFENIDHPGVPLSIIYSTSYITENGYRYKANPKNYTDQGKYGSDLYDNVEDYTIMGGGDSTVSASSFMLPIFKFISEHRDGINNYPLDIISYCSNTQYNSKLNYSEGGLNFFNIGCDCKKPMMEECTHAGMIMDSVLIKQLTEYGSKSSNKQSEEEFEASIDLISP